ncbi:tat pathway signal sequence [Pyrenophora seminiperda CCB06]|uniref:Tat pathway signal sequence n=1 Tax=Pyrenophora seminiperda CCB06 TaxID=1302712 RepID=A0A3M7LY05_9PLEO|nr:tat pathway signal sequence [Pyrenophora seminiperda CCB06]
MRSRQPNMLFRAMDWDRFEQRARDVVPQQELKAGRCLIGVLDHRKLTQSELQNSDFTWMIGHEKISIRKILATYQQQHGRANVLLMFKDKVLENEDIVKTFLVPGDNLVLFIVDKSTQVSERSQPSSAIPPTPIFAIPLNNVNSDNVFRRESSLPLNNQQHVSLDPLLRRVTELQHPNMLEAATHASMEIIEGLKKKFSLYATPNTDAEAWSDSIEKLLSQKLRNPTIVGVVGSTGAGKSSVVNAMLDEERLLPTNCMRACTAVVTEISYNSSTDPFSKYRAEIEFVSSADWEKELTVLLHEFLGENGKISSEAYNNPTSEAGVAWAQFRAVYPSVARDALGQPSVSALMSNQSVIDVLGTIKQIRAAQPEQFHLELQQYVDSKEKVFKKENDTPKPVKSKARSQIEYWPLIKTVKIYTKSPALSTGAVIVDLPGVQDSNPARAAIAQTYMKQCTGLWIVAPINRAVDDKAAKTLLGDSFKRQLKYDGAFSNVTFICSKTDDISITEAIDSLGLEDDVSSFDTQNRHHDEQISQTNARINDLKETLGVYRTAMADTEKDIEVWEELQEQLDEGIPVFAPPPKVSKRKDTSVLKRPSKKQRTSDDDSDSELIGSDEDNLSGDDDSVSFLAERSSLSEAELKTKLKDLREAKRNARNEGVKIRNSMNILRSQMCGRMQKDEPVPGFVSTEDTEIPQLQAHCQKLTEAGRVQTSRAFLTNLAQLLNNFELWLSSDNNGIVVGKPEEVDYLKRRLHELTNNLDGAVEACMKDMRDVIKTHIYDKCPQVVDEAVQVAPTTVQAWGDKYQGGLGWSSYKAVVRRDGVHTSMSAGNRDFNSDLVDPIIKRLVTPWERTFQLHLPKTVKDHVENLAQILDDFYESIQEYADDNGLSLANLSRLKIQVTNYNQVLKDLGIIIISRMNDLQRNANRDFTPCIKKAMVDVYKQCTIDHGAGSFKRMRDYMENHVERERSPMFNEAVKTMVTNLDQMCEELQKSMMAKSKSIGAQMSIDYLRIMGGVTSNQPTGLPSKEESQLRSDVREALRSMSVQLELIAHGAIGPQNTTTCAIPEVDSDAMDMSP